MFTNLGRKLAASVILTVAVAGSLVGTGAVHAQDNIGNGTPCTFGDVNYPEGSIIKVGFKSYICLKGVWWDAPEALTPDANSTSVGSTHLTPSRLAGASNAAALRVAP